MHKNRPVRLLRGGDGMMNLVGNAILGSDSVLGVVPCGTGNDWARTIGVSQVPEEALRTAFEGKVVLSDVGWVPGHRHFFNVAGIGFDAEVSRTIDALPQVIRALGSSPSYVISVLTTFLRYKSPDVSLMLDGQGVDVRKMLLLAIGIARYYGSGMMILPDAQIDDGLFDIAWGCDLKMSELSGLIRRPCRPPEDAVQEGKYGHGFKQVARAVPPGWGRGGRAAGGVPDKGKGDTDRHRRVRAVPP